MTEYVLLKKYHENVVNWHVIRPPDIVVGGRRFYRDSSSSSSIFFFIRQLLSELWTELNQNRPHVRKWVRFENVCPKSGVFLSPKNRWPQTTYFRRLRNLTPTLAAYTISSKRIVYIIGQVRWKLQGVSYTVSKCHELWSTNGLKLDRHFYPPSVNSAFYFIARLRAHGGQQTEPNFSTYWEVNRVCKCMSNIWRVHREKNRGAKDCLFCDGSHLNKTVLDDEKQGRRYPPSINALHDYGASGIRWRRIANVHGTVEIKSLISRGPKNYQFAMASRRAAWSCNTSLIASLPILYCYWYIDDWKLQFPTLCSSASLIVY